MRQGSYSSQIVLQELNWTNIRIFRECENINQSPDEHKGYQIDLKDHIKFAYLLICEIIHLGYQTNASAMKETKNGFNHNCQYSWKLFQTKW